MRNLVVIHYLHGKILKGVTRDFFPGKKLFHLDQQDTGERIEVEVVRLKAIFFVKKLDGDPYHQERLDAERSGLGKRVRIRFLDGETLIGYTRDYAANKSAFFVHPADPDSNNEKTYIIKAATDEISFTHLAPPVQP